MNSLPRGYEEIDILREITKFKKLVLLHAAVKIKNKTYFGFRFQ